MKVRYLKFITFFFRTLSLNYKRIYKSLNLCQILNESSESGQECQNQLRPSNEEAKEGVNVQKKLRQAQRRRKNAWQNLEVHT